ncbi:MAG: hypothetical protein IT452_03915 [Planctomycetia bacterium]|nr:hypothetical protein [Planctomycetia bacterium]
MPESQPPPTSASPDPPPTHEPRRSWRILLPGSALLAALLALGIRGWWQHRNEDLFRLAETTDWTGEIWEPKSDRWHPLGAEEAQVLVRQFSRAHDFRPLPTISCGTVMVNYGSPRYFVRLSAPTRTTLVFGVWASGQRAYVWLGQPYGPRSRWVEFGGDSETIAAILKSAAERFKITR